MHMLISDNTPLRRPFLVLVLVLFGVLKGGAATITWDGDAGNFLWQDATNWSDDVLPGANDDVVIDVAGEVTVTNTASVTIRSLQSSNHLTLTAGTFRVTAGSSVVEGQLTATGGPLLSATGAGTTLTLAGPVNPGGVNLEAAGGAVLALPTLTTYSKPAGCALITWQASGAGSVLNFPGLAAVTGAACADLSVRATAGGQVLFPELTTVHEGALTMLADGANSLVDLPQLQASLATEREVTFEARNAGTVALPVFPGGSMAVVSLKSGGVLPVAQLRQLRGFTVSGMNVDFPALTNLVGGNVLVDEGAVVTVTNVARHQPAGCPVSNWNVSGENSVLDMSGLAELSGPGCGWLNVRALASGRLILTNLAGISDGTLYFIADGAGSAIDLSALEAAATASRLVSFDARNNGSILMPLFTGGSSATVTLQSGGQLPVTQLEQLAGFTVNGMAVNFPALTNLANANVTVSGGGVVSVPGVGAHEFLAGCHSVTWRATGPGSRLEFPNLATLTGPGCGWLNVEAIAGGHLTLGALTTLIEGTLYFLADGTDSRLDLSALDESLATARTVTLTARNQGTIAVPLLTGGSTVSIAIQSGGSLDAAQMNLLKGLTVSGTSLTLPGITNLFAGNLVVDQGAVLSFPNLFSHDQGDRCVVNSWTVSGAGSVLDLSSLTNLVGSGCAALSIEALAGGRIILTNLPVIADGGLIFQAEGANSRIELDALTESLAASRAVNFEALNSGTIFMPQMTGGPTVAVTVRSNGAMPVAQLTRLNAIVASGTTLDFTSLNEFDGGALTVTNGAVVTLPGLQAYDRGPSCALRNWLVRDAGSVLALPGLVQLAGATCGELELQALGGGHLLLGALFQIPAGNVEVLASGAGSLIDLSALDSFMNPSRLSRLEAVNGGTILLNEEPFLLSGVRVDIAAGTPGLPATTLAPTDLVLHGGVWRSYWVERRDTTSPANPWLAFRRVPLTNEFQVFAPAATAGVEFRVTEFVADPGALELTPLPGVGVGLVFFGPSSGTFDVQTATNLGVPTEWHNEYTIEMTNTFRVLPAEPLATPRRFFQAVPVPPPAP